MNLLNEGKYDGQFHWADALGFAKNGDVNVADVYLGMHVQKFTPKYQDGQNLYSRSSMPRISNLCWLSVRRLSDGG